MTDEYKTIIEIAKICGVSVTTVHSWRKKGLAHRLQKVAGRKTRYVFLISEVEDFRNLGVHDV